MAQLFTLFTAFRHAIHNNAFFAYLLAYLLILQITLLWGLSAWMNEGLIIKVLSHAAAFGRLPRPIPQPPFYRWSWDKIKVGNHVRDRGTSIHPSKAVERLSGLFCCCCCCCWSLAWTKRWSAIAVLMREDSLVGGGYSKLPEGRGKRGLRHFSRLLRDWLFRSHRMEKVNQSPLWYFF